MCGLVGYITTEGYKGARDRANFMEQGLIIDILRGEDSTGVFYGKTMADGCQAGWYKSPVDGYTYTQSKEFQTILGGTSGYKYMVGHNRAATIGTVGVDTAHPFVFGDKGEKVIGVHNGTVQGAMAELPISFAESEQEVDSACIIKNLAHVDPEDALTAVISKIRGAYMLIWRDDRDGSLNFARNNARSFHLMQSYDNDTIYFASEHGQLAWLNDRLALGGSDVVSLRPGYRLKFKEGSLEPEVDKFDIAPKYVPQSTTRTTTPHGTTRTTYASSEATAPGKPQAPLTAGAADNRVLAGGKKRSVPQPLQLQLLDLMQPLAVEDRLQFTPIMKQPKEQLRSPDARRWVAGMIDSLGISAMIYSVEQHVCSNAWDRRWTVRPIGVRYSYLNKVAVPTLVCALVASVSGPEILTLPWDQSDSSTSSTKDSPKEDQGGLKGPAGYCISTAEWLSLTTNGCVSCGRALTAQDADSLRWDCVSEEPQCPECAKQDDEAIAALEFGTYDPMVH